MIDNGEEWVKCVTVEELMKSASKELTNSSGDKNILKFVSCNHSHTFPVIDYVSNLLIRLPLTSL